MNNDSFIINQVDNTALNRFFGKIYGVVAMGIGLSALVSFLAVTVFQSLLLSLLSAGSIIMMLIMIGQIALVVSASAMAAKNSPMALPMFLAYSVTNGITISMILMFYTSETVVLAFVSAALMFAIMAVIGMATKKDLSGMAQALRAALWGIIIASVINIFLRSSGLSFMMSIISVLVFSGLIAYDNQRIRNVFEQTGGNVGQGWVVSMALQLYLDFINLFLNLLRIFGGLSRD
ncbi:TPA: Bax inhibitor-1/YccA family protein [Streptococcus suis]|uniref:Bax inhibitor-1/YccA family protein n=1 Tax=Streptococcus suis TaxID=1307 RepID=UPI0015824967|nr:Bax inhibitor-1/YccA family protein [Streptococcus suis]MCK3890264.1 Bax inhibitor-1/YccA family protein [Streptococcus suis]HEM4283590.1 Bax inhibitor-1/YccA family protein [Streptococcus suis]HEM4597916.1 Bax inhibitor-1/YccA family protein [Streptococcus suis]HEM6234279.1 Bax inhibitor-1/YccA family protein [Streptococcus suis]HEM6335682.1 Bax inhibitor-1/YccA family protein [Streptococcus suis]